MSCVGGLGLLVLLVSLLFVAGDVLCCCEFVFLCCGNHLELLSCFSVMYCSQSECCCDSLVCVICVVFYSCVVDEVVLWFPCVANGRCSVAIRCVPLVVHCLSNQCVARGGRGVA